MVLLRKDTSSDWWFGVSQAGVGLLPETFVRIDRPYLPDSDQELFSSEARNGANGRSVEAVDRGPSSSGVA